MSHKGKDEEQRVIGVQVAYHIMKEAGNYEDGMKKLEERLTKAQQIKCPVAVRDDALREFETSTKHNNMLTSTAISMMILRDKFGFGNVRGKRFMDEWIELADTIWGGWLSWDDVIAYVKETTGCDLRKYIELADEMYDKMEKILETRKVFTRERKPWKGEYK